MNNPGFSITGYPDSIWNIAPDEKTLLVELQKKGIFFKPNSFLEELETPYNEALNAFPEKRDLLDSILLKSRIDIDEREDNFGADTRPRLSHCYIDNEHYKTLFISTEQHVGANLPPKLNGTITTKTGKLDIELDLMENLIVTESGKTKTEHFYSSEITCHKRIDGVVEVDGHTPHKIGKNLVKYKPDFNKPVLIYLQGFGGDKIQDEKTELYLKGFYGENNVITFKHSTAYEFDIQF